MRTIQFGREFLKESPCTPDPKISAELVHVSCNDLGAVPLGSTIVGMQDLPESQRVGLRLESQCEVQEWTFDGQTDIDGDVHCFLDRGWRPYFHKLSGGAQLHRQDHLAEAA
jgi:hypothetical protein